MSTPGAGRPRPGRTRLVEIEMEDVNQLFNLMDPSPFIAKDLDADAEEFIFNWVQEYAPADPIALRIHLARWSEQDPTPLIAGAVHNFFAYRAKLNRLEFRRLMQQGRTSLIIGLASLVVGIGTSQVLLAHAPGPWFGVLRESLTIAGWVAMWRPMQIFLHDWWPVRRKGRVYDKLSRMPVEVVRKIAAGPVAGP